MDFREKLINSVNCIKIFFTRNVKELESILPLFIEDNYKYIIRILNNYFKTNINDMAVDDDITACTNNNNNNDDDNDENIIQLLIESCISVQSNLNTANAMKPDFDPLLGYIRGNSGIKRRKNMNKLIFWKYVSKLLFKIVFYETTNERKFCNECWTYISDDNMNIPQNVIDLCKNILRIIKNHLPESQLNDHQFAIIFMMFKSYYRYYKLMYADARETIDIAHEDVLNYLQTAINEKNNLYKHLNNWENCDSIFYAFFNALVKNEKNEIEKIMKRKRKEKRNNKSSDDKAARISIKRKIDNPLCTKKMRKRKKYNETN